MKRSLSIVLTLVMLVLSLPVTTATLSVDAAETLPEAVDLSETIHLPPIGNQGAVGCCASMAATYMQFTNAYSRYMHEVNPSIVWNPSSGDARYCFSPRFTYNLAGAGTAWVYEILKEQGTVPQSYSAFSGGVTGYAQNNALANDWATVEGYWEVAQNFRISNYDQIWLNSCNFQMTTSTAGLALINRIKQSLNQGNVVVTGGYVDTWVRAVTTIKDTGSTGKSGDKAIPYSVGPLSGGHQVSIIGYDDNITCEVNGVTLKGAFKVANSWGSSWYNDGCIWMMYDAMNEVSPYSALNVSNRVWTMDQVVFLDYKTDLNIGTPALTASVELSLADRDAFSVTLLRTDINTGKTESYLPYMFEHEDFRPTHNKRNFYYGYGAASGWLTFNFDQLVSTMEKGKTVDDYLWSIQVSTDEGAASTLVKNVKLNKNGETVYSASPAAEIAGGMSTLFALNTNCIIHFDLPEGAVINTDSESICAKGSEFSFTVTPEKGYRLTGVLKVTLEGNELLPDESGKYSFTVEGSTTVKVSGIVPAPKSISASNYNGGETNGSGQYWYIVSISNSQVVPAVYDLGALNNKTYRYTFRCTVDGEETYEFVPASLYLFDKSTLYRIAVSDGGWFPKSGTTYKLKFDICLDGIPVYTTNQISFKCTLSGSSQTVKEHTHSYTGERCVYTDFGSCAHQGTGYRYCAVDGCLAIEECSLPALHTFHSFEGAPVVTQNATAHAPGVKSNTCKNCGESVLEYFTARKGDMDGNDAVDVSDVTVLLNYLSKAANGTPTAADSDVNGDGYSNIKDVTMLLLMLSGTISD